MGTTEERRQGERRQDEQQGGPEHGSGSGLRR